MQLCILVSLEKIEAFQEIKLIVQNVMAYSCFIGCNVLLIVATPQRRVARHLSSMKTYLTQRTRVIICLGSTYVIGTWSFSTTNQTRCVSLLMLLWLFCVSC